MAEAELRLKIKSVAVDHFSRDGYHGATVRNIARDVGCSLPMINYYFKSKRDLFHEIIERDYFELLDRLSRIQTDDILEFYTRFVSQISSLDPHDKKIYRLGVKVYLGFDGDEELAALMEAWERSIVERHCQLLLPRMAQTDAGPVVVSTLIHLLENLIESIVVKDRVMTEDQVRAELAIVLAPAL